MQKKIIALGLLIGAMVGSEAIAGYDNKEKGGRAGTKRARREAYELALSVRAADKRSNVARHDKAKRPSRKSVNAVSKRMQRFHKERTNGKSRRSSKLVRFLAS